MAQNSTINTLKPVPREAIAEVKSEEDFVELLRRELDWPIPISIQRLEDVAIPHDLQSDFSFAPDEDRIAVSRLLNLSEEQPWGIFLFEFKTKRPYLTHLRRLIRVLSSQRSQSKGDPIWDKNDLIFICTPDWQSYQFVHFSGEKPESAVISSFGWHGPDDPFLHTLCKHNLARLRMPAVGPDSDYDPENWRAAWLEAFSVKPVTDEFYKTLKEVFNAVQSGVQGLTGEEQRFFAELIVNRMVFLKFVEKKGWLNSDTNYLYNCYQEYGKKNFWQDYLSALFFEGLCKEKAERTEKAVTLLGDVPFLNAELFAPTKWLDGSDERDVNVENRVFSILFDKLLNPFNFTVTETSPLDVEVAFNQDLLGYGYEELIADQHGQGAYYTHPTEVNLMCRESLRPYLEGRCPNVDKDLIGRLVYAELSTDCEIDTEDALSIFEALHDVTVVDPALGSGTFPVAMMKHLFFTLQTIGENLKDSTEYKQKIEQGVLTDYKDSFNLKLHIIERSLYGCDIDYFAVQIAKLRFWIELMVECDHPEALPNFDCKLVVGDALVSVVGKDKKGKIITLEDLLGHPTKADGQLFFGSAVIEELSKLKKAYFKVRDINERARIKKEIEQKKHELLSIIGVDLGTIDRTDKHVLWQIDFAEVFFREQPGFDIAIANPPYLRQELINKTLDGFDLMIEKEHLQNIYKNLTDISIGGQADLYIYFYLRSSILCKGANGVICIICSNSWLDASYGKSLQLYLLKHTSIYLIMENRTLRSFKTADINTVISIFVNGCNDLCGFVTFLTLKNKISNVSLHTLINHKLYIKTRSIENDFYRLRIIEKNKLVANEDQIKSVSSLKISAELENNYLKWGGFYLRAPEAFFNLIESSRDSLISLSELADIRRGYTTGANDFFYLNPTRKKDDKIICINSLGVEVGINESFLKPVIKNTRECRQYLINQENTRQVLFICDDVNSVKGNESIIEYIKWGEQQKFHLRPTCSSRTDWWSLDKREPWPIWWVIAHNERDAAFVNKSVYCSDNFFEMQPKEKDYAIYIFSILVSSWGTLQRELLGRGGFGGGLLKTQGPDLKQIKIPNPMFLSKAKVEEISKIGKELFDQNPISIHNAWDSKNRRLLDHKLGEILGLDNTQIRELYLNAQELVAQRQMRSKSFI